MLESFQTLCNFFGPSGKSRDNLDCLQKICKIYEHFDKFMHTFFGNSGMFMDSLENFPYTMENFHKLLKVSIYWKVSSISETLARTLKNFPDTFERIWTI